MLTVPGFPFSSSPRPRLFSLSLLGPGRRHLADPSHPRAIQSTKAERIEPQSLLDCETLPPHPPPSLSPPKLWATPVPRTVAAHRIHHSNRYITLEVRTHAYTPTEDLYCLGFNRSCHCTATRTRIIHILEDVAVRDNARLGRTSVVSPRRLLRSSSYQHNSLGRSTAHSVLGAATLPA